MIAQITGPSQLAGSLDIASSKSEAHRALICAALAGERVRTEISCSSTAEDIIVTVDCLRALGAVIQDTSSGYEVWGIGDSANPSVDTPAVIHVRESGSTLRFLLPIIAALGLEVEIHATGRLPERPLDQLLDTLESHGAHYESRTFPLKASGKLSGGVYTLPGNVSSQYITGLLLAAPLLSSDLSIELTSVLESRGYLDLTIDIMKSFGVSVIKEDFDRWSRDLNPHTQQSNSLQDQHSETVEKYSISASQYYKSPGNFAVTPDHSSAAFWLGANELGAEIELPGIKQYSLQPDAAAREYFTRSVVDISRAPDLFPILAVVAAAKTGQTMFTNARRLRYKESDRLSAVACMLESFGVAVIEEEDKLTIPARKPRGEIPFTGARIDSHSDHRIAMAATIAATHASGITHILDAECVRKSYPAFFEDYQKLGGKVEFVE